MWQDNYPFFQQGRNHMMLISSNMNFHEKNINVNTFFHFRIIFTSNFFNFISGFGQIVNGFLKSFFQRFLFLLSIFIPFLNVLPSPNEKLRETNWGWWDLKVIFALASHFAPKWLVSYKTHTLWLYNTKLGGLLFGIFNILNISRKVSIFRLDLSQIVFKVVRVVQKKLSH